MASGYDHFQVNINNTSVLKPLVGTTTFRNLKLDQETSLFSKFRISYTPPSPITHLVVNNNHLVVALSNKILRRIDLLKPNDVEEIDLNKFAVQAKIYKIFLDPSGQHMIISIVSKENDTPVDILYLPWKSNKPRVSTKLKGLLITAVGWNQRNTSENSSGQILVGTYKGLIFEMELTWDEKQSSHERNMKQVFDLTQNQVMYFIIDLEIAFSPSDPLVCSVFCNTSSRLFQYTGHVKSLEEKPLFLSIFQNYTNSGMQKNFLEHPTKSSNESFLQLNYLSQMKSPSSFVWVISQSIYSEDITWTETALGPKSSKPFYFPENYDSEVPPCGFVTTQFHILLVWPDKIIGICLLNNQVVFEDFPPQECGQFIGIDKDSVKGTIWVYSERGIFKYKVDKEDRNIWKVYLDQGNFNMAKKYSKSDEFASAFVLVKEAEALFNNKEYEKSAKLFATTLSSFEEVCLKFMEVNEEDALKVFLKEKLDSVNSTTEQTQMTLFVLWLMELHMRKLGTLRDTNKRNTSEYRKGDEEFQALLRDPKVRQCIHQSPNAIYNLLASHDDQDNYVGVALIMKDFNRVVLHLMAHQRHIEALKVMSTQNSDKLFYQHTPTLLQVIARDTIDALIVQGRRLNPVILLPALVQAHSTYGLTREVLRYLEFCVDKLDVKDQVIHNFLITLYCSESSEKLLSYLKLQGEDGDSVNYDVKFALRECTTAGHDKACIHILTTIGLYQEAVEMALKVDTALAKAIANKVKHNEDLCKKLWLMIAAHVVQKEQNVGRAMKVLQECSLIKIEDILPFFPDFVTIDQFKDAICKSLQDYNQHIDNLKEEMEEATRTANNIRNDIKKFKKNHLIVRAQDRCSECNFPLLTRSFYLFPCSHKFHQDCLTDAVMNCLSDVKQKQVSDLRGKLIALASNEGNTRGVGSSFWSKKEQLRLKIDSIVASECLYCGEIAVNSVDAPFIPDEQWTSLMEEWQ